MEDGMHAVLKRVKIVTRKKYICGIKTEITFHVARHTFATTVTLENGVPIDSVSKMLGHRSIKTTQIYAKVSDKKISDDTQDLFRRFLN